MGREVAQVDHPGVIRSIQYSPDGRYLAIGSLDWSARVYEAATGKEIARVNHDGVVSSVRLVRTTDMSRLEALRQRTNLRGRDGQADRPARSRGVGSQRPV